MNISPLRSIVQGCLAIDMFRVVGKERKQYIFVIGEDHNLSGNAVRLLNYITDKTKCPLNILVEKPFTYDPVPVVWPNTKSNVATFFNPPYDICTDPTRLPDKKFSPKSDQEIRFYENCIRPFRGNTKIWAIDLRWTGIFRLLYTMTCSLYLYHFKSNDNNVKKEIRTNPAFSTWFEKLVKLQTSFIDFTTFQLNPSKYDTEFRNNIADVIRTAPDVVLRSLPLSSKPVEQIIQDHLKSRDRSHMTVMKHLSSMFSLFQLTELQKIISSTLDKHSAGHVFMWSFIMDLEFMFRIYKLLGKQKEGFLICFVGDKHRERISQFLSITTPIGLKIENMKSEKCIRSRGTIELPSILCSHKTSWMKLFEKEHKKGDQQIDQLTKVVSKLKI